MSGGGDPTIIEKLRDNLSAGADRIRWFSGVLSERVKIEISVIGLLNDLRKLEAKRDEGLKAVGQRVYELRTQEGVDLLQDARVRDFVKEVERLEKEMEEQREKIAETGRPDSGL